MAVEHLVEPTAAAPDYDEIVRVIGLYIEGFNDSDIEKFREAFHEDAWIFYTDADGKLDNHLIAGEDLAVWSSAYTTGDLVGRILSVFQAGDVASVQLVWDGNDEWGKWLDTHALLRIDGVWKITNKTATHYSRAGQPDS